MSVIETRHGTSILWGLGAVVAAATPRGPACHVVAPVRKDYLFLRRRISNGRPSNKIAAEAGSGMTSRST